MPKTTPFHNNLNAGEISPHLDARIEVNKYQDGCITLENFIPLVEGGVIRVPGTYFINETKTSSELSRMVPFKFSTIQNYHLLFGKQYIRFYKDHGMIVVGSNIDDFDPSDDYFVNEYTKIGSYRSLDFGGSKFLYVVSPFGQTGDTGISVGCVSNSGDTLAVEAVGSTITIKIANTTGSKNAANLIQTALRALGTVNAVDVSGWTVTENTAYAAARPAGGVNIVAAAMTNSDTYYQCILAINSSTTNRNFFPLAEPTYWTAKSAGAAIEIAVDYLEAELYELKFLQSSDTLFIFHENHQVAKLVRYSHENWKFDYISFTEGVINDITDAERTNPCKVWSTDADKNYRAGDVVYIDEVIGMTELNGNNYTILGTGTDYFTLNGIDATTYTPYQSGGKIRFSITGVTQANPAVVTMPKHGFQNGDYIYIHGVKGMTELNGNTYEVANRTATTFQLAGVNSTAYGAYTSAGSADQRKFYIDGERPSCGTFFEQRLVVGGFINYPTKFLMSVTADYYNFTKNPNSEDAAIEYDIVSDKIDRIKWFMGESVLLGGTDSGIYSISSGTLGEPITNQNIQVRKQTAIGASEIDTELTTDSIMFVTRGGTNIRQLVYNFEKDKYIPPDMTRVAKHILVGDTLADSGVVDMDFQTEPFPILWCVRGDGQLVGMSYEAMEEVYPWFRVVTDGEFESISINGTEGEEDEIYVTVKRTINGATKRYVEYFMPHKFYSQIDDCFFVHSGLSRDGAPTETISGLGHLEAKTVSVLGDGIAQTNKVVSSGAITITSASKVHVGLPCPSILIPTKPHVGNKDHSSRGKKQKINKVVMILHETCGGQIGPNESDMKDIEDTSTDGVLFTGDAIQSFDGNWGNESTVCIKQSKPYPMTVLGLVTHLSWSEE